MVQAAPAWRSAGRTFFDQPRQVLTVAGNGLASYRLSDAVLRGREIADVSAAEERNRVAPGGKSVAPMLENLCGGQMSSRSSVNRQCIRSPFAPDRSIPPTLRPLMRWFVLRLFPDLFFRPDNLIEAIAVVGLETFFASGHAFVARRQ